ncbi:hypothetical protein GF360_02880 [candidate division WWE3 bacterium]|nr:hypothetical protein [candidate division WWE3 bacterium]
MTINRLPNSEHLTDDVLEEIFEPKPPETAKDQPNKFQEVTDLVYETDPLGKALTGRTPERLEEETGIPTEIMFPKDAKILYVGDPWQRMGRELDESHGSNLTLIDYEYGEVASFVRDDESFRESIARKGNYLAEQLEAMVAEEVLAEYNEEDAEWLKHFNELVQEANKLSEDADSDEDYARASEAWGKAREYIEETHKADVEDKEQQEAEPGDTPTDEDYEDDELAYFRTSAWYDCVYGERGFKDIPDWNNIIKPKVEALEQELSNLPEQERERRVANETRSWIEEIRLQKRTEKSNVVEAVFPQLPFKDEAFDRLVASWSISAHVFAELDEEGFEVFWDETHRVLADQGEAYIFPLNYYYYVDETLINSLEQMKEKHPDMDYAILNNEGTPISYEEASSYGYGDEYTLVLHKGIPNEAEQE